MTFSIVGRAEDGHSWGVAVAWKFLAVGAVVPAAAAGVGALATQASVNVAWKRAGLELLGQRLSAQQVVDRLILEDGRDDRQLGVVDAAGRAATHTGAGCLEWAGGVAAPDVAIQGNILAGRHVVDAMQRGWVESAGEPLGRRLLAALDAGDRAGGDRRGRQSAALLVVAAGAGYGGLDDVAVDLRVDDAPQPIAELRRLLDLNDLYLTASTDEEKVAVTAELASELDQRARELGSADFLAWVGTENYEMRVAEDGSWVDRRVLEIIRSGPSRR